MIDHSNCDHPRTRAARSACRRRRAKSEPGPQIGTTPTESTPKDKSDTPRSTRSKSDRGGSVGGIRITSSGRTMSPRWNEGDYCDRCGLELAVVTGKTLEGFTLDTCYKCSYAIKPETKRWLPGKA